MKVMTNKKLRVKQFVYPFFPVL